MSYVTSFPHQKQQEQQKVKPDKQKTSSTVVTVKKQVGKPTSALFGIYT